MHGQYQDLPKYFLVCMDHNLDQANKVILVEKNGTIRYIGKEDPGFKTPLPPPNLMKLVSGMDDKEQFVRAGSLAACTLEIALRSIGKKIEDFNSILDFGCGCGRVLVHLQRYTNPKIFGTDYNSLLIDWCKKKLSFCSFEINSLEPPLSYRDAKFDFIYAFSVLTHLAKETQKKWLKELSRILTRGGLLLVSTRGNFFRIALDEKEQRLFDQGKMIIKKPLQEGKNECMAYHPYNSLLGILPDTLRIVSFIPEGARGNANQDLYLLRKSPQ